MKFLKTGGGGAWRTAKSLLVQPGAESADRSFRVQGGGGRFPHLLQDVPVELLLAVAQEFADHLAAEALPLQ